MALLLLLGAMSFQTCAVNPVTGKKQIAFISEEKEIAMGKSYDPQVIAEMGLYDNPKMQQFLSEKGMAMARESHRPNLPWSFKLVDNSVVNAFAVPGGFVYFTRGIMAHFNNEAQFAGVLGHEIGHVTARHTVAQQSKQQLLGGAAIVGMILSPELASQGESVMQGMQMLFLKYGRDAESQSDQLGVEYSTKIGYDAKEMAGFFGTLDRLSGGAENRVPTFMSTHPDPIDRKNRVQQLAQQYQAADATNEKYDVGRDRYLRMIDGMLYGEDPKQGFTEAGSFYHPELRFQFKIPGQWTLINSPSQVQIVSPDQQSYMIMRLAQGADQQAAAQSFVQETGIKVANTSQTPINGLPATAIIGDITQEATEGQAAQSVRVKATFISYGGNVYMFAGLADPQNFSRYQRDMDYTMSTFAELRDQSKLNRQPERIKIVSNARQQSLQQALLGAGVPQDRLQEFAILNGMELNQTLPQGMLFKAFSGGTK